MELTITLLKNPDPWNAIQAEAIAEDAWWDHGPFKGQGEKALARYHSICKVQKIHQNRHQGTEEFAFPFSLICLTQSAEANDPELDLATQGLSNLHRVFGLHLGDQGYVFPDWKQCRHAITVAESDLHQTHIPKQLELLETFKLAEQMIDYVLADPSPNSYFLIWQSDAAEDYRRI